MKFKNSFLGLVVAAGLVSSSATAQEEGGEAAAPTKLDTILEKAYAGATLGPALAFTDIKQYPTGFPVYKYRSEIGSTLGLFVGYKLNTIFSVEGALTYTRLHGTRRSTDHWFRSKVLQWDLNGRVNLSNVFSSSSIDTRKLDVYFIGGFGMSAFRAVKYQLNGGNVDTDYVVGYEGYVDYQRYYADLEKKGRTMIGSINAGFGLSYRLNENIDILADFRGYMLFGDKLDAHTSSSASNDKYLNIGFGAIYHFGGTNDVRTKPADSPESILEELQKKFEDSDNDGVLDINDKDNNTPAGVKVYPDGTAIDTDGDGVADYKDQEIISPCKEVDANGVAKDGDNDGVVDCNDIEPNSAANAQVDGKGKTIATSMGVAPTVAPSASEATSAPAAQGRFSGLPPVFFSSNASSVSYKNYESLTQVAQFMKTNETAKIIVVGNSDQSGSKEYNKTLAQKRAQAVVDHLVKNNGIDASRLSIQNNGSEKPISTKRNSHQDRRVDFLLGQ